MSDSIDIAEYNFIQSIAIIASTSIDRYQGTPIGRWMYERKLYCEEYLDNTHTENKENIKWCIKNCNEHLKHILGIVT